MIRYMKLLNGKLFPLFFQKLNWLISNLFPSLKLNHLSKKETVFISAEGEIIQKLVIAVSFHYVEERLKYLSKIALDFPLLANQIYVFIVTNTEDPEHHKMIRSALGKNFQFEIYVPKLLGHPYLLTWCHFDIFRKYFNIDEKITHFMYIEDDIHIRQKNISYWLKAREDLRPFGLIPSFLRIEFKPDTTEAYSTDTTEVLQLDALPKIKIHDDYFYINLPNPYQGMYLLDRALMYEHLFGHSSSPDFGPWQIREKAAQGLTFANVPSWCNSRNFVGFNFLNREIDPNSLIHHLPNNYANNPHSLFGKIAINNLIL